MPGKHVIIRTPAQVSALYNEYESLSPPMYFCAVEDERTHVSTFLFVMIQSKDLSQRYFGVKE
jgi:hypothetical protein